jgi:hypothetical protein
MRMRNTVLACALLLAPVRLAAADDNVAKADALFAEAVKLRDSNLELACAKFGASLRLNPQAIGTLLNVALCDEKLGRVASALRRFQEARERAIELNFAEHLKAADQKIAALTPDVPHLALRFEKPPLPQTKVVVDDRVIPLTELEDLLVDPGERTVTVSAPGRITFQQKLVIEKGKRASFSIPPLAKAQTSSRRTVGTISLASGAAMLTAGVVLGYVAHRRYDAQFEPPSGGGDPPCKPAVGDVPPTCNSDGFSAVEKARTLGNVGTVIGSVGLAAILVGGYLWYSAPRSPAPGTAERTVGIAPQLSPTGGGLAVFGRF